MKTFNDDSQLINFMLSEVNSKVIKFTFKDSPFHVIGLNHIIDKETGYRIKFQASHKDETYPYKNDMLLDEFHKRHCTTVVREIEMYLNGKSTSKPITAAQKQEIDLITSATEIHFDTSRISNRLIVHHNDTPYTPNDFLQILTDRHSNEMVKLNIRTDGKLVSWYAYGMINFVTSLHSHMYSLDQHGRSSRLAYNCSGSIFHNILYWTAPYGGYKPIRISAQRLMSQVLSDRDYLDLRSQRIKGSNKKREMSNRLKAEHIVSQIKKFLESKGVGNFKLWIDNDYIYFKPDGLGVKFIRFKVVASLIDGMGIDNYSEMLGLQAFAFSLHRKTIAQVRS